MAKAKNKKTAGKKKASARKAAPKGQKGKARKVQAKGKLGKEELGVLRKSVEEARARLDKAKGEFMEVVENTRKLVDREKEAYLKVLVPYREACKKAGVECEFGGGRIANVSERVSFLVEKTDKGIKVAIKGREAETTEVIPKAKLKESIGKAAYAYTSKHLGPREKIGNKGGSLSNRLRKVMAK